MNRPFMVLAGVLLLAFFILFGLRFGSSPPAMSSVGQQSLIETKVNWHPWGRRVFARATAENKLVFLNLSPFWCEQCARMDLDAYNNDSVATLLNTRFLPVRVDPDRRPDVGERYHLGGFPSLVILTPGGDLAGGGTFLPTDSLLKLLSDVDRYWQTNRPFVLRQAQFLSERYRSGIDSLLVGRPSGIIMTKAERAIEEHYDSAYGGFGTQPKFPQPEVLRFLLNTTDPSGVPIHAEEATRTLEAQLQLLDTVWGGFYRYARFDDWSRPSHEKLVQDNARLLDNYLDAYVALGRVDYRAGAEAVINYLTRFLETGRGWGFWNSQHASLPDAEGHLAGEVYFAQSDSGRLADGIPPIDSTIYTGANCIAVSAYLKAGMILGDQRCREYALTTLGQIIAEAADDDGALLHDVLHGAPDGTLFLADQVAGAGALLDAYEVTGDNLYLERAENLVELTEAAFTDTSSRPSTFALRLDAAGDNRRRVGRLATSIRPLGWNCEMVTVYMRLHHLTADVKYYRRAAELLNYLFTVPLAADDLRFCHLADAWLWYSRYPVKFVLIGMRDEQYYNLAQATWDICCPRSVLVHLVPRDGEIRLGDLVFPDTDKPQLFVCDAASCSIPIEKPETAADEIRAFLEPSQ